MPTDDFDPSLLIFAAVAAFVLWRLRSVLGERTERDLRPQNRFPQSPAMRPRAQSGFASSVAPPQPLAPERWKGLAESGSKAWSGLDAIAAADPNFSGPAFVEGAQKAYDLIVRAFAKGDRDTLRRLLSPEVYNRFLAEIATREKRGETVETAIVAIDGATVEDASAMPRSATITVRFVTRLISTRRDRNGEIVEGGTEHPASIVDLWTFSRDPASRDPNWKLVATTTAH